MRTLVEEINFEVGHFRSFGTSVTLTLTLYQVIWHTAVYHSSTSTHQISFKSEKKLLVDGFIRSIGGADLMNNINLKIKQDVLRTDDKTKAKTAFVVVILVADIDEQDRFLQVRFLLFKMLTILYQSHQLYHRHNFSPRTQDLPI